MIDRNDHHFRLFDLSDPENHLALVSSQKLSVLNPKTYFGELDIINQVISKPLSVGLTIRRAEAFPRQQVAKKIHRELTTYRSKVFVLSKSSSGGFDVHELIQVPVIVHQLIPLRQDLVPAQLVKLWDLDRYVRGFLEGIPTIDDRL